MKTVVLLLSLFFISSSIAQTNPKKGMTYDKEAMLYYKLDQDENNLYISLFKDEYAVKVKMPGGIKIYFNLKGCKDTLDIPVIRYPIVKKAENWERLEIKDFKDISTGEYDVSNEFGIGASGIMKAVAGKESDEKTNFIFEGKITVPKLHFGLEKGTNIAILILLMGQRLVAIPPGRVSPILNSTFYGTQEMKAYFLHVDTWSETWIDYVLE